MPRYYVSKSETTVYTSYIDAKNETEALTKAESLPRDDWKLVGHADETAYFQVEHEEDGNNE